MSFLAKLHTRIFLSHFVLAVAVMLAVGWFVFDNLQRTYFQSVEDDLQDQAVIAGQRLAPLLAQKRYDEVQAALSDLGLRPGIRILVTNVDQVVVGSTEPEEARLRGTPSRAAGIREALRSRMQRNTNPEGDELVYVAAAVPYEGTDVGVVRVSYGLAALEARTTGLFNSLAIGILAVLLVSGLVAYALAYRLSRSARRLADASQTLAGGDLTARTRLDGNDELAEAGRAFDQMADQLQAVQLERQALLNTMSREIHAAISGMAMALEVLRRGKELEWDSRDLLLGGLQSQGRRLRRLADDLVEAARVTRGPLPLYKATVFPAELVREVAGSFTAEATDRGARLECVVNGELPPLNADQDRLTQALGNLVESALSYTPPGGRVLVTAEMSNGSCVMAVHGEDFGPAAEGPAPTFGPFAGTGELSGRQGLRLAITRAVVEAHGGQLQQARLAQGGSIYRMSLPLNGTEPGALGARPSEGEGPSALGARRPEGEE